MTELLTDTKFKLTSDERFEFNENWQQWCKDNRHNFAHTYQIFCKSPYEVTNCESPKCYEYSVNESFFNEFPKWKNNVVND